MSAESNESQQQPVRPEQPPLSRWSLKRLREEEQERSARYRGLAAAWHVWRADYGIAFVLFLLAVILSLVYLRGNLGGGFVYDESYVNLRLARNLPYYHHFVFDARNAGSTASPLYVSLVALISRLTRRVDVAAFLLAVLALAGVAISSYYWSREATGRRGIATVSSLLTVTSGWVIFGALAGTETGLLVMLLMIALALYEKKSIFTGIPLALSVMTGFDAWFFVAALAICALLPGPGVDRGSEIRAGVRTRGRGRWARIGSAGIFLLSLAVFASLSHCAGGPFLPSFGPARTWFLGEAALPFVQKWTHWSSGAGTFCAGMVVTWPLLLLFGLIFARRFWTRGYVPLALVLFYAVYLLRFPVSLGRDWSRHQQIFIPFLMLAVAEGSFGFIRLITRLRARWPVVARIVVPVLLATLAAILTASQVISIVRARGVYVRSVRSLEKANDDIIRFVSGRARRGDAVAAEDVGVIGYMINWPLIDLTGEAGRETHGLYVSPLTGAAIPWEGRDVLGYVLDHGTKLLIVREDPDVPWRQLFNFDPDTLGDHFRFVGEGRPVYPQLSGGYRVYEVREVVPAGPKQ